MIKLDSGNVMLKPSHRKQLLNWLKRAERIGNRIGQFALSIRMVRVGRAVEIHASVSHKAGQFVERTRRSDLLTAMRDIVRALYCQLHQQQLAVVPAA
jgi:ribosome-associated translation inhibitor RaiA